MDLKRWSVCIGMAIACMAVGGCYFRLTNSGVPCFSKPLTDADVPPAPIETMALEQVWEVPGNWCGLAIDPRTGDCYSAQPYRGPSGQLGSKVWRIDRKGNIAATILCDGPAEATVHVALAHFGPDPAPGIVMASSWGTSVRAFDGTGHSLWRHETPSGINDICAADLDWDGVDEVVVGYIGGTSLLGADGSTRWALEKRSAWSVAALEAGPWGGPRVVTVGFGNQLHSFDSAGGDERTVYTRYRMDHGVVAHPGPGRDPTFIAACSKPLFFCGIDVMGRLLWTAPGQVDPRFYFTSFAAAEGEPWFACASAHSRRVYAYDVRDGRMLASVEACCWPQVGWLPAGDGERPLLVVATTQGVRAFRMREGEQSDDLSNGTSGD